MVEGRTPVHLWRGVSGEVNVPVGISHSLFTFAVLLLAQGQRAWAARLWGAAEALREAIGAPIPPIERAGYDCSVAAARLSLGERVFADMWAQGRSMSLDQVLVFPGRSIVDLPSAITVPSWMD